jgi:hypothetical protein
MVDILEKYNLYSITRYNHDQFELTFGEYISYVNVRERTDGYYINEEYIQEELFNNIDYINYIRKFKLNKILNLL